MGNFTGGMNTGNHERAAAVAGSFYSLDPNDLRNEVEAYYKSTKLVSSFSPRLIISPHAGFIFSGAVAAKAYAHLSPSIKRVIIIGPSHYQGFNGIAYPEAASYLTPLGKIDIDEEIVNKIKSHFKSRPTLGLDRKEHCIEVQLPFLQVKLHEFKIVPLLTGRINPQELAEILFPHIDNNTVVVASSDLSHYHAQNEARKRDDVSISTILKGCTDGTIDGCGEVAIRTVMHIARQLELQPVLLDAKTSFETAPQHCSESQVVGYASIIYIEKSPVNTNQIKSKEDSQSAFSEELQKWMLLLARRSLIAAVHGKQVPIPEHIPKMAKEMRGCFITIIKDDALRGCIGYIEPVKPLYQAIIENSCNAAMHDHRFTPVTVQELDNVIIEISILTNPQLLQCDSSKDLLKKLRVGIDGVILSSGHKQATFLPQVWEQLPDKIEFLEHLAQKAGLNKDDWKKAVIKIYSVEYFTENAAIS